MEGIEFNIESEQDTNGSPQRTTGSQTKPTFLFRLLALIGVSDPTVANFILLGFSGILFGLTIFIYARTFGAETNFRHGPNGNPPTLTAPQIKPQ